MKETDRFIWMDDTIPRGWGNRARPLVLRKQAGPFWTLSLMMHGDEINALLGEDDPPPTVLTFHDSARPRVLSWLRWYCAASDFSVLLDQLQ